MSEPISPGSQTRQQIYDRIRMSSRDEVILEEMIRLGFWSQQAPPSQAAELIHERTQAVKELNSLYRENARWSDPERALKEMHKRRKLEAKERRIETKKRHAQARQDRATNWLERRRHDVLYLGEGVSAGLNEKHAPRPSATGLPLIKDARELADLIGIVLGELRFLTFNRPAASVNHYKRFTIAKKTGGERLISAPMPRLKRAQYWILDNILTKSSLHDAAHGFVPSRSILTNARNHVGKDVVINLDLKDFFPSVTYARVKGLFQALGYCEAVATPLALLTTEPVIDEVKLDGQLHFLANGPRILPQGAPTSPMITNLICRRLDSRLQGLAGKLGFNYSRYADDMTFSASGEAAGLVGRLLRAVREIVEAEGFCIHPDKTRVMRKSSRQEVTGLVVNQAVSVPRDLMRRYRAVLHQVESHGPAGRYFGAGKDVIRSLVGFGHFISMVDRKTGEPLLQRARQLAAKHPSAPVPEHSSRLRFRRASAKGITPPGCHWIPVEKRMPVLDPVLAQIAKQEELKLARKQDGEENRQMTSPPFTSTGPSAHNNQSEQPFHSNQKDGSLRENRLNNKINFYLNIIIVFIVVVLISFYMKSFGGTFKSY